MPKLLPFLVRFVLISCSITGGLGRVANAIPPQCCVGAIGDMCAGVPPLAPRCGGDASTPLVNELARRVSVGSILHDNCCIFNYPDGHWCHNGGKDQNVCKLEWDKATDDVARQQYWVEPFTGRGDEVDIRPVPSPRSLSVSTIARETFVTSLMAAPEGEILPKSDVAFCQSKRFKETAEQLAIRAFGTCAKPTKISIVGTWRVVSINEIPANVYHLIIFRTNGTAASIVEGCTFNATYETEGNNLRMTTTSVTGGEECEGKAGELFWEKYERVNNTTLKITWFDNDLGIGIHKLVKIK